MYLKDYGQIFSLLASPTQEIVDLENDSLINTFHDAEKNTEVELNQKVAGAFKLSGGAMYEVRDDALLDAGVLQGDVAIVDESTNAVIGDLAVVKFENNYLIRYLFEDEVGCIYLACANDRFDDLYLEDIQVMGVVCSIVRNIR